MRKYYDIDRDIIYTEDELRVDYETRKRNGEIDPEIYDNFGYYLGSCMAENNGSLVRIAPDWMIHRLQRSVANDIACEEMTYGDVLGVIQKYEVFSTWTVYEINNRPVDVDALSEWIAQELGVWK